MNGRPLGSTATPLGWPRPGIKNEKKNGGTATAGKKQPVDCDPPANVVRGVGVICASSADAEMTKSATNRLGEDNRFRNFMGLLSATMSARVPYAQNSGNLPHHETGFSTKSHSSTLGFSTVHPTRRAALFPSSGKIPPLGKRPCPTMRSLNF